MEYMLQITEGLQDFIWKFEIIDKASELLIK